MPLRLTPATRSRLRLMLPGGWRRATAAALGALPVAIGITASAHAAVHRPPAGAVKLPARSIKHVSGATCGKVRGVWRPGTVVTPHWFVTDTRQADYYRAAARRARGSAKRADLSRAKFYRQRATKHQPDELSDLPVSELPGCSLGADTASLQPVRGDRTRARRHPDC